MDSKYEATKISGALKMLSSEFTFWVLREVTKCIGMLSSWWVSVCKYISVKPSAYLLRTGADAAGVAPLASAGLSAKEVSKW